MKCVFYEQSDGHCHAEMTRQAATWNVDEETKKSFCTTIEFNECPRYHAKMDYLSKSR